MYRQIIAESKKDNVTSCLTVWIRTEDAILNKTFSYNNQIFTVVHIGKQEITKEKLWELKSNRNLWANRKNSQPNY